MKTNAPAAIAVAVVHNKLKPKEVSDEQRRSLLVACEFRRQTRIYSRRAQQAQAQGGARGARPRGPREGGRLMPGMADKP